MRESIRRKRAPSRDWRSGTRPLAALHRSWAALRRGILLLALVLIATGCDSSVVIVNDLNERDANEMLVLLNNRGVLAEKLLTEGGTGGSKVVAWNLAVPASKRFEALAILNDNGLPRRRAETLLSLFSKQGLVSSEKEEQVRYQAGLAEQIANTIRKIDGVLDSDVQLSIPQEEVIPGQSKPKPVTASVYIKHNGILDNPNAQLEIKVKRLVSGSIPGLSFDDVTVIGDSVAGRDTAATAPPDELLTRIWGVRITRGSERAFRWLFGGLIALVAILGCALTWLLWKLQSTLTTPEGRRALLDLAPLQLHSPQQTTPPPETPPTSAETPATAPSPPPSPPPSGGPGPLRAPPPNRGGR